MAGGPAPQAVAAALLLGLAAMLLLRAPVAPGTSGDRSSSVRPGLVLVAAGALVAAAAAWLDAHQVVLAAQGAVVVAVVVRMVRRSARARAADARSLEVLTACDAMASDLAAGQPPGRCLDRAAQEWAELAPAAAAARMGADVPSALRELAGLPGARHLRTVAATWQVAHSTGAGLASALSRAADSIRDERRTTRLVASELAAAHATARMLAVLPVGVVLLGAGIGGDPLGFLTDTTAGLVCLGLGLALSLAGLTWIERIADRVLRR